MKTHFCSVLSAAASLFISSSSVLAEIQGDYLEARSCDVYTGSCVANSEMGLSGKEAILVWSIRSGDWSGVDLAGLKAVLVVQANGTLGDLRYDPRRCDAVLILDERASATQREALRKFALAQAGKLASRMIEIQSAPIDARIGTCSKEAGCASVKAGSTVEISTRCLAGTDHLCGNEDLYYPPLTAIDQARPAYAEVAAYKGASLPVTWQSVGKRSVYIGSFSL